MQASSVNLVLQIFIAFNLRDQINEPCKAQVQQSGRLSLELQGLLKDISQLGKDAFDMQLPDILLQTLRSRDLSVLGETQLQLR